MRNFNQGGSSMGSPRGASRFGAGRGGNRGGSRFGGGDHRSSGDRGPVTMHDAICSKCGKDCEVPFRPTGDKPIYCNDCFSENRDRGGRSPRREFGSSAQAGSRPLMRSSFGENRGGGVSDEVKKQLEFLGLKIDRLTKVVEGLTLAPTHTTPEKSAQVKKAIKEATSVKKASKKKVAKKSKV